VGAGAVTTAAHGRIIPGVPSPPAPLSPAAVPTALRDLLPEGFALEPAHHGQSAAAAFVRGPGEPLVLKHAAATPYTGWLVTEAEVLRALAETTLPVPRVRGLVHDDHEAWLLLTRLPGEPLVEVLPRVPASERPAWFRRLGELLATIHITPVPAALRSRDATPWRPRPRPARGLGAAGQAPRGRPKPIAGGEREALSATHLEGVALAPPLVLVHGDFTLDNVLADDHGPCGVVDWGGAGRGDPRYDVALALLSAPEGASTEPGEERERAAGPGSGLPTAACVRAFYDGYLGVVAGIDPSLYAFFSASRDGR
jgi:aminoglycoside 3'-phosphotransferase I